MCVCFTSGPTENELEKLGWFKQLNKYNLISNLNKIK